MTEAVFFDVGSTLIRPCPSVAETFARVAAERGHDLTVRDVEPHMPAMDAYYEAEYLRDGDFWCSHEGSTAIWLDQYRYVCHLAGIGHDAEGVAQTVHEAYRRAECWETYADVTACLESAWGGIRAGSGIELGCGLGRAPARPGCPYFSTR